MARAPGPLGAGLIAGAKVVAAQVLVAPVLGERLAGMLQYHWLWRDGVAPLLACVSAAAVAVVVLRRTVAWPVMAPFGLFAGLVLAAALAQPMISISEPQWVTMARIGAGQRYWMLPMLAWLGVLALLATDPVRPLRLAGGAALLLACVSAAVSFRYPDMPPTGFPRPPPVSTPPRPRKWS